MADDMANRYSLPILRDNDAIITPAGVAYVSFQGGRGTADLAVSRRNNLD